MADFPWFKFYPSDWLGKGTLRRASHATKGFYIDLLCVMFDCEKRGRLEAGGVAWTEEEIARSINGDTSENISHLRWLVNSGVLSKDDSGVIYSRRMVKDEARRQAGSEAGKRGGGNPDLAKSDTDSQTYIGKSKGKSAETFGKPLYLEARNQILDTRSQKLETTPPPSPPSVGGDGGGGGRDFDSGKSSDPVAAFAEWRNVEAELRNLGVGDAKGAVENCQMQGMQPNDCRAVVAYWKSKPDDYWPNPIVALHQKLTRHTEGEAVDSAWLQPADKYVRREENAKATQERQQARQRELIPKSETNPVRRPPVDPERFESEYGPILSAMTRDERESFFREVAANEFEVGVFQKGWKPGGGSRKKLLRFLAERQPANTS